MTQRPIKFRQFCDWEDTVDFGMHYFDLFKGSAVKDGGWSDPMKFTGLHDKNGKEIWEGDIGKLVNDHIIPQYALCVCEWRDEHGCFSWIQKRLVNLKNPSDGWAIHVSGFEVIGNIYENPELIKS